MAGAGLGAVHTWPRLLEAKTKDHEKIRPHGNGIRIGASIHKEMVPRPTPITTTGLGKEKHKNPLEESRASITKNNGRHLTGTIMELIAVRKLPLQQGK